jgi:hypothetical protein
MTGIRDKDKYVSGYEYHTHVKLLSERGEKGRERGPVYSDKAWVSELITLFLLETQGAAVKNLNKTCSVSSSLFDVLSSLSFFSFWEFNLSL